MDAASVVYRFASSLIASEISPRVSRIPGAVPITAVIAACVNAVVAICVVFVPGAAVGAAGTPVKVGEARGANPEISASDASRRLSNVV
jgi:hypothetical protein